MVFIIVIIGFIIERRVSGQTVGKKERSGGGWEAANSFGSNKSLQDSVNQSQLRMLPTNMDAENQTSVFTLGLTNSF